MSVNQFACEMASRWGLDEVTDSPVKNTPRHKSQPHGHGQYYCVSVAYGRAHNGTTGWIVSLVLRTGTRTYHLAETNGSLAKSSESPSDTTLHRFPSRRAQRHLALLGL